MKCNNCINCNKDGDKFYCIINYFLNDKKVMTKHTVMRNTKCTYFYEALDKVIDA